MTPWILRKIQKTIRWQWYRNNSPPTLAAECPKNGITALNLLVTPLVGAQTLVGGGLEDEFLLLLEGHSQLQQPCEDVCKVPEEEFVVLGVCLNVLAEDLVLDEGHVCGQHHEGLARNVLKLLGTVPLLP